MRCAEYVNVPVDARLMSAAQVLPAGHRIHAGDLSHHLRDCLSRQLGDLPHRYYGRGVGLPPCAPREVLADAPRIFHDHFGTSRPNHTHEVLTKWEARVLLEALVKQNIGNPY